MAETIAELRPITFEQAALLDSDCFAGEIVEGRWEPVTRNTWRHGEILVNAGSLLREYAKTHAGWLVAAGDPGARLRRNPDTLRGPDVGMIRVERRPTGKGAAGWLEGAPDLAVEIGGDAQSAGELARKALEYLGAGARLVWVLDPEARLVMVFTPPREIHILGDGETLDGGEVLPGFSCQVAELFE